jgi:hypothetical protein
MSRARWFFLIALFVFGLGVLALRRTGRGTPSHAPPRPPVREVTLDGPDSFWQREGFVPMDAPVRPPTSEDGRDRIVVYLKLPAGGVVTTRFIEAQQRYSLEYPTGTLADRVEYQGDGPIDGPPQPGWRVGDVRGASLASEGDWFHVYRGTTDSATAPLLGLSWPRGDDTAQLEATSALVGLVLDGRVRAPRSAAARATMGERLRSLNGCAACHARERPPRARMDAPGIVNRASDSSGFFQVSTVLSDRAPLEMHRPRNLNVGDPFMRFVCGEGETPAVVEDSGLGSVRCPGREVPVGVLDLASALRAADPHALRVCASRRFLYEHLDALGRSVWIDAMAECGGG